MSVLSFVLAAAEEGEEHIDRTHSWIWPEGYEILFGGISSTIVFGLLIWKAGPFIRDGMRARTARIKSQLDEATEAKTAAAAEAEEIRRAKGDIEAERGRILAEADAQAEALLRDGGERLEREIVELDAKADADIAAVGARASDELRAEISRLSAAAADELVSSGLPDSVHQDLIEGYIARVGASGGVASHG